MPAQLSLFTSSLRLVLALTLVFGLGLSRVEGCPSGGHCCGSDAGCAVAGAGAGLAKSLCKTVCAGVPIDEDQLPLRSATAQTLSPSVISLAVSVLNGPEPPPPRRARL